VISIIICTANLNKINVIENNISITIGVDFELIIIDNSRSNYSIFQAYNLGVKRSQYPLLCFMHDDIVYHSENWGGVVIDYFSSPDIGMIGIGGTRFLSSIPTIWWAGGHRYFNSKSGTICHNSINTDRNNPSESKHDVINPELKEATKVVVIDGLWFCIRKDLFDVIEFDERNFGGFHFYDLDISMQINKLRYNVLCIFNIKIEHISDSQIDKAWIENCNVFYHKWKSYLPISLVKLSLKQLCHIEFKSLTILRNIYIVNKTVLSYKNFFSNISFSNAIVFHLRTLFGIN
jgi:hypothetical protein